MASSSSSSSMIPVIINFVNTALGGALGLMGNVFAASKLGIVWFSIGSFINMILCFVSIICLCRTAELSQSQSTHDLAKSYFGKRGSLLTKCFICLGNWSFVINIIQIFADFAPQILRHWFHDTSFLTTRWFAVIIGLLLIFPWILVKDISKLERLSIICIGYAIFIFTVLIMNGSKCLSQHQVNESMQIFVTNPYDIFLGLPTISWCWSLQFNAIPIYLTLHPEKRLNQINIVSLWSVFILFIFYGCQGIAVYLVWGDQINTDYMTNLDHNNSNYIFYFDSWLSTLTQFIISIACFFSIPIFTFEARTNLHAIIKSLKMICYTKKIDTDFQSIIVDDTHHYITNDNISSPAEDVYNVNSLNHLDTDLMEERSNYNHDIDDEQETDVLSRCFEGTFICISAALVAMLVSNLNLCLSIAGATYGCYISYFLPSGAYIIAVNKFDSRQLKRNDIILKYIAMFSIGYGAIVCIAGIITAFI